MIAARARLAVAGLALLPCLLVGDAVLGRAVFYERDIITFWLAATAAFVRSVGEGAWPLWDPLTNFGRPLLADPSMQLAYPLTWLNLIFPPGAYFTLFVLVHCSWAGVGAMMLGRAWGLSLLAAAGAGLLWMSSGPYLSTISLYHHFASASWMAWVLLALEGVIRFPGPKTAGGLALAAAGLSLAGSADMVLMTGAACVARTIVAAASGGASSFSRRTVGALAMSCLLAALLSAAQWWGAVAHVAVGSRGAMGSAANMYWSAHPATLIDVVVPGLVTEMPLGPAWRAAFFEGRGPLLRSLYLGIPAILLAVCALAAGRWPMRWLVAALAAAFLVAALGRFTPIYPLVVGLPLVRLLRFPVKYMIPAALFVSLLAGAGVDAIRGEWDGRTRARMRAVLIVAVAAALALGIAAGASDAIAAWIQPSLDASHAGSVPGRLREGLGRSAILAALAAAALMIRAARGRRPALIAVPLAVAALDVLVAGRSALRLAPPELLEHRPALLDAFARAGEHRIYRVPYGSAFLNEQFTRTPPGWDPDWAWALGHVERLAAPISTRFGLAGSYDGDFTGLTPVALTRLTVQVDARADEAAGLRLLQMGSVTDVVAFAESFAGAPPRVARLSVFETPVRVFAVPDPMPRAYVVSGVRIADALSAIEVVTDTGFDPRREVVLDADAQQAAAAPAHGPAGRAEIVARRSDRLTLSVWAAVPSVLVVTEAFDPGWRAWVDGRPQPVWRANAIFRGIAVGPGEHRVEMRYRPPAVAWGAGASLLGVVLTGLLIGRRTS